MKLFFKHRKDNKKDPKRDINKNMHYQRKNFYQQKFNKLNLLIITADTGVTLTVFTISIG